MQTSNLSPMMRQYFEIKEQYPECLLFYRLGDFYELFFDDAKTASMELELVLTGRDCGQDEKAPMCGVPYHSAEGYVSKLIAKGYRIAICEQTEDPSKAKGIVKREVVRVLSPGTVTESAFLRESENNYICALYHDKEGIGAAFADISTGEINAVDIIGDGKEDRLFSEAASFAPRELITDDKEDALIQSFCKRFSLLATKVEGEAFLPEKAVIIIREQLPDEKIPSEDHPYSVPAVGALLSYLKQTQKTDLSYIKTINYYDSSAYLELGSYTRRNLEITSNLRTGDKKGSLLWVVDKTKTAFGARLLKKWLDKPLINCSEIKKRQEAVGELVSDIIRREELAGLLKDAADIERLATRIVYGTANAKDLKLLETTIALLPSVKEIISSFSGELFALYADQLDTLDEVGRSIADTIVDSPPFSLREGGFIKPGCNESVDELREMMTDGKSWLAKIEAEEKEKTGIRTLKVGYNRVFGYYIEVSKSFVGQVPAAYIRRQTLANSERYVTEELKDIESRVIGAKDRVNALEYEIFTALRDYLLGQVKRIQKVAEILAAVDVLVSFALAASECGFSCPEVDYSDKIILKNSRHPVVEKTAGASYFVPNDCELDCGINQIMLITGPNMAGKSTYMRQVALCVLLAQAGSYIPASEARIGVVDKIFTRVGASDDLATGMSTFMVEMTEVADILTNATKDSLIIYDEIGRGTSTYDGMSIAKAIVEHTKTDIGAKTLFATHYHELTELESEKEGIKNYNIAAKKRGNEITFLRKIIRGPADDSYGIEVAHLAGIPSAVVKKANKILAALIEKGLASPKEKSVLQSTQETGNITFSDLSAERIKEKLLQTDINMLSPYEAMSLLFELKKIAEN